MSEAKLTNHERRRMRTTLRQTRDVRLYRRLLAILEYDMGTSTGAIAKWLNVSRQSVYNWIARFQEHRDTAELNDAPHSGRPARADEAFDTLLRVLLML